MVMRGIFPCKEKHKMENVVFPRLQADASGMSYQCPLCGAKGGTARTVAEALKSWNELNDPTVGDPGML